MNLALRVVLKAVLAFLFCAVFSLVALAELMELQRVHLPGLLRAAGFFVRHVLLVPGILPLIVGLTWVVRFRSPGQFWGGGLVVIFMAVLHFFVFAVSAHSDLGYPLIQLVEAFAFCAAIYIITRGSTDRRARCYQTRPYSDA